MVVLVQMAIVMLIVTEPMTIVVRPIRRVRLIAIVMVVENVIGTNAIVTILIVIVEEY